MYYAYYDDDGNLVGLNRSTGKVSHSAIEISQEEYLSLGGVLPAVEPPTIEDLQKENKLLRTQLQAQTERSDFIEDCIAEMATMVYGGV